MSARATAAAWAAALVVVVGAGTAGGLSEDAANATPPPAPSPSPSASPTPSVTPQTPLETAQLAAVRLSWPCDEVPSLPCTYGSGSVVDSSGLILTNAHVAQPTSPGLAAQYEDLAWDTVDPPYLIVSVPPSPEADAVPRYRASVVTVDGYTDLAVVRVDRTLEGAELTTPPVLTNVPLGALSETKKDDVIRVIGYPMTGDSLSPTVRRGTIVSKPTDPEARAQGPWELNTDAPIHGGNSGGMVVDEQGRLVGIPAYRRGLQEQTYRARAVELARPMVEAAQRRAPLVSPYLVPGTGQEQLVDVAWSDEQFGDRCVAVDEVSVAGVPDVLWVQAQLTGLAEGEDYRIVVTGPESEPATSRQWTWTTGQGCTQLRVSADSLSGAPQEGTYEVTAYVGPEWTKVGDSSITLTAEDDELEGE